MLGKTDTRKAGAISHAFAIVMIYRSGLEINKALYCQRKSRSTLLLRRNESEAFFGGGTPVYVDKLTSDAYLQQFSRDSQTRRLSTSVASIIADALIGRGFETGLYMLSPVLIMMPLREQIPGRVASERRQS
nr:hypothetical protein [Paraburkholderia hospita]